MSLTLTSDIAIRVEKFERELKASHQGHAAVSYENLVTGETVAVNAEQVFPAASVIKVPVGVEAMRQVEAGFIDMDSVYAIHESRKAGGSGVLSPLHSGLQVTFRDLLTLMIIVSDNTATNMVIDLVGMDGVNETAGELGLKSTLLRRKLMGAAFYARPDYRLEIDNTISAADMGKLLRLLVKGEAVSPAADAALLDIMAMQQVNDRIPLLLPAGTRVAHKTGEFQTTRHDVGVVFDREGRPAYVLAVLTRDLVEPPRTCWAVAELSRDIYRMVMAAQG